jgi:hypothetical protein
MRKCIAITRQLYDLLLHKYYDCIGLFLCAYNLQSFIDVAVTFFKIIRAKFSLKIIYCLHLADA